MIEGVGSFTAQDKSKTLLHAERDGLRKSQTPALVTGSAENAQAFVAEVVLAAYPHMEADLQPLPLYRVIRL